MKYYDAIMKLLFLAFTIWIAISLLDISDALYSLKYELSKITKLLN